MGEDFNKVRLNFPSKIPFQNLHPFLRLLSFSNEASRDNIISSGFSHFFYSSGIHTTINKYFYRRVYFFYFRNFFEWSLQVFCAIKSWVDCQKQNIIDKL